MQNTSGLPSEPVDWEALARYFAGESRAEEAEAMRRWLAANPDAARELAALDTATAKLRHSATADIDVGAAWRRTSARLAEPASPKTHPLFVRTSTRWLPALRAAAVILIIVSGTFVWRAADRGQPASIAAVTSRAFTTAAGERDSVVLTDGTGVLLGPGSSLRVDDEYGLRRRDVHLDGEALFDVRHDDARPFVVHAADLMIHDLGTTFTVRTTNGTNGMTSVAVTSGAVRVSRVAETGDTGVVLHEGDLAAVDAGRPVTVRHGAALDDELAWTRGELVFRDTPLPRVAAALRRWYGVDVRIDSTLDERTLTASFGGEPLADVLNVIGLALEARVQRQGDTVIIARGPARGGRPR